MEFLEVPLYDDDILKLLVRFAVNLFFLAFVLLFALQRESQKPAFQFTAVMLNITVFFICFTLKKFELDIGMALGLFAIFGVLRYRTDTIDTREMTYLFIVIGLAVINSLSNKKTSYAEVALVNGLIVLAAMFCGVVLKAFSSREVTPAAESAARQSPAGTADSASTKPQEKVPKYTIEYDQVQLLGDEDRQSLIDDLRGRTGLAITRVQVKNIDLTQGKATLQVWCDRVAPG
ncbi:MAG: DUF4956 domain-containing protein [Planctomycetota bacterium]